MDPLVRGRSLKTLDIALRDLNGRVDKLEELISQLIDGPPVLDLSPEEEKEILSKLENVTGRIVKLEKEQERPKKNGKKG